MENDEDEKYNRINPDIFNEIKEFTPEMEELLEAFLGDVGDMAGKILKQIEEIDPSLKDETEPEEIEPSVKDTGE
jgi:hypothetical protein